MCAFLTAAAEIPLVEVCWRWTPGATAKVGEPSKKEEQWTKISSLSGSILLMNRVSKA